MPPLASRLPPGRGPDPRPSCVTSAGKLSPNPVSRAEGEDSHAGEAGDQGRGAHLVSYSIHLRTCVSIGRGSGGSSCSLSLARADLEPRCRLPSVWASGGCLVGRRWAWARGNLPGFSLGGPLGWDRQAQGNGTQDTRNHPGTSHEAQGAPVQRLEVPWVSVNRTPLNTGPGAPSRHRDRLTVSAWSLGLPLPDRM